MNEKNAKIVAILIVIIISIFSLSPNVYAKPDESAGPGTSTIKEGGTSIGGVTINPTTGSTTQLQNVGGKVLNAIRIIGTFISVGILMILGIQYMMGSSEQKAEYKKTMIPYVIGAVLLFAATTIGTAIYNAIVL